MSTPSSRNALRSLKRELTFAYFRIVFFVYRQLFASLSRFHEKYIVESTRRKQWFYRAKFPVFREPHFIGEVPAVTAADSALAQVVQHYWLRLRSKVPSDQTVWTLEFQGAEDLVQQLEATDTQRLALMLNGMFHSSYIQGIAHGFRHTAMPSSRLQVPVVVEDRLISLAEYLGVVAAETIEQGICGLAMKNGLEPVVAAIERSLGFSLSFPENFGASGIKVGNRVITQRQAEHVYTACRLAASWRQFGGARTGLAITEIGAGYGGLCLWIHRVFGQQLRKYYIIDLPWVNVFQSYFLKKVFGDAAVAFWNDDAEKIEAATIVVCSSETAEAFLRDQPDSDIYLNQDSLPEMPEAVARNYLQWVAGKAGALFFSYQQENGHSVGRAGQSNVHELMLAVPAMQLQCRNLSWTRDGYTEETYRVA